MAGSIPNHPEFDRSGPGLSGAAALARSATTTAGSGHIRGAESTLFGLRQYIDDSHEPYDMYDSVIQ